MVAFYTKVLGFVVTDADDKLNLTVLNRIAIDLTRSADDLRRETKGYCRAQQGSKPLKQWQANFVREMASVV